MPEKSIDSLKSHSCHYWPIVNELKKHYLFMMYFLLWAYDNQLKIALPLRQLLLVCKMVFTIKCNISGSKRLFYRRTFGALKENIKGFALLIFDAISFMYDLFSWTLQVRRDVSSGFHRLQLS